MTSKGTTRGRKRRPSGTANGQGSKSKSRGKSRGRGRDDQGSNQRDNNRPGRGGNGTTRGGRGRGGGQRQQGGGRGGNYGNGFNHHEDSVRSTRTRTGSFEDLFAGSPKGVLKIGLALRELVREVLPEAEERVHLAWKIALYNDPNEVCGIQLVAKHCNLYFSKGAMLDDPEGLLEGTGKSIRHVKVRSTDDMPVEHLKSLIAEAKRVAR